MNKLKLWQKQFCFCFKKYRYPRIIYILHPGTIDSEFAGEVRTVGYSQLLSLYGVNVLNCKKYSSVMEGKSFNTLEDWLSWKIFIDLYPLKEGNYNQVLDEKVYKILRDYMEWHTKYLRVRYAILTLLFNVLAFLLFYFLI